MPSPTVRTVEDVSIRSYLAPGETLLWSGSPKRKIRLGPQHAPLFFVALIFASFLILVILGALNGSNSSPQSTSTVSSAAGDSVKQPQTTPEHKATRAERIGTAIFLTLFFGSILGSILFAISKQFGGNSFTALSTIYVVTDQRIVIITGKSKKLVTSLMLSTLSQVQMQQWSDGLGTITFGPRPI